MFALRSSVSKGDNKHVLGAYKYIHSYGFSYKFRQYTIAFSKNAQLIALLHAYCTLWGFFGTILPNLCGIGTKIPRISGLFDVFVACWGALR